MKKISIGSIIILFLIAFSINQIAEAEVLIPEEEFTSFFDINNQFTVVGVVRNLEEYPVIPTITLNIKDGEKIISKSFEHAPILPSKDLPFKIKFPEITSKSPILLEPDVTFFPTIKIPTGIEVIYDKTLVTHEDGHLTGRIINNGNSTVYNIKVLALIWGHDKVLDMGQNVEMIEKMEPGEIRSFTMYPDPSITDDVYYYSCFAPSDTTIVPVYTERNGKKFYFRYDGGTWYYDAQFNKKGTELTMKTQTSFPVETFANFEFPQFSEDEKFNVYVNDEPKKIIQSIDEMNNWHVAFIVEPKESGEIKITGFSEGWDPGEGLLIPDWVKFNSGWWAENRIDDKNFVRGLEFMIKEEIITISNTQNITNEIDSIPQWVKYNALWWSNDLIDDETFVVTIQYLIEQGIIKI